MSFSDNINATTINASKFYKDGEELKHDHIASGDITASEIKLSDGANETFITPFTTTDGNEYGIKINPQYDNENGVNIVNNNSNSSINVGIGTTTPQLKLTIGDYNDDIDKKPESVNDTLRLNVLTNMATSYHGLHWYDTNKNYRMSAIRSSVGYDYNYCRLHFSVSENENEPSEKMTIAGDGNVGIGVTLPSSLLSFKKTIAAPSPQAFNYDLADVEDASKNIYQTGITFRSSLATWYHGNNKVNWTNTGVGFPEINAARIWYKPISYYSAGMPNTPGIHGSLNFSCGYDESKAKTPALTIISSSFVGIGNTEPRQKLHVNGNIRLDGVDLDGYDTLGLYINSGSNKNIIMVPNSEGKVGIGTTEPDAPLHIGKTDHVYLTNSANTVFFILVQKDASGNLIKEWGYNDQTSNKPLSIVSNGRIWAKDGIFVSSDSRIKENIIEVKDDIALKKVRDISCCWYNYKDKFSKGYQRTIGFIAQQVKEHLPEAVSQKKSIIPNEMRILSDVTWDNTMMTSNSLNDVSGVKYRFYVSNDISGNDEVVKEIIGNSDNTFTFDQSYNNVGCYGKEVNDFHVLDKQKLFALNFSATQEIDRIQQKHKQVIAELNNKVISLQNQLESVLKRLDNLESN